VHTKQAFAHLVAKINPQGAHGFKDGAHGMHKIVTHGRLVTRQLLPRVAIAVDNLHLLHQCALARLASAFGEEVVAGR